MTRKSVSDGHIARRSQSTQSLSTEFIVLRFLFTVLAFAILSCISSALAEAAPASSPQPSTPIGARAQLDADYGKVPLSFEPNQGQSGSGAQFLARGSGYTLFLSPERVILELERQQQAANSSPNSTQSDTVKMQLLGSTGAASGAGLEPLPGIVNYFIGNDPGKWRTSVPTFRKVNFAEIYPAIDLVFYGNQRQLEYDFVVKPDGEPARIGWSFRGAQPHLDEDGSLELSTPGGSVRFLAPVAYQVIDGQRRSVSASYSIAHQAVRFALGEYDHSKTLIIDPVLSYFSYLGGTGNDYIGNSVNQGYGSPSPEPTQAVGIDSLGNLYVAGTTSSTDFPLASPAVAMKAKNSGQYWAFVSKFSPDGSKLLYSTYIGGSAGGNDAAWALAVDSTGNAYVTGAAQTNDFPVTSGAFQTVCAPYWFNLTNAEAAGCTSASQNAFVLKLNPTGSMLIYSSFLGGQGGTWGTGIAVDSAGQAYVTGVAQANGCGGPAYLYGAQYGCFPTTANALISDIGGGNPIDMAFMSVFNATGSALVYSTLFGDSQGGVSVKGAGCTTDCGAGTYGTSIALDPHGNVYIGGRTVAANMVTTTGAFNTFGSGPISSSPQILVSPNGYGYVAKFAPVTSNGTSLLYSTYFGGGAVYGGDVGGLAGDSNGNVYITGDTHAADFPATAGAYQTTCDPNQLPTWCGQGAYVAKLNPTGTALVWATYLGNGSNAPLYFLGPVILDSTGNVYVLGEGNGKLPLGGGNLSTLNGPNTVYIAEFNPSGSQVLFGATVAGPNNATEKAGGMAIDSSGAIYVGGAIGSGGSSFATSGAFQQAFAGGNADGFVAKVLQTQPSTTALTVSPASPTAGQQVTLTAKVTGPSGSTAVPTGTMNFLSGSSALGSGTLDGTGTATYSTSSLTATTYTLTASYGGDSNYSASSSTAQSLVVNPIATTTTLTISPGSAVAGQTVTFTAKVKENGGTGTPTGTVTFLNGSTQLYAGSVDSTGTATFTSSALAVGTYSVTAAYSGDANDASSTSSATSLVISVASVATTTTLTASATTITGGGSVTFTATVKATAGGVVATGSVTFKDGSASLGTGTLDGTGKATYSTTALSVGGHSITAIYGGDSGNLTSTSSAVSITVNAPPPADFNLSISPSSGSDPAGTAATVTVTVTPVNGFNQATTFACSGLPVNSTCAFSPATVTPNGIAASTTTMTIESEVKAAVAFAGGSLSLLLLPMVTRRNRRRRGLVAVCIPVVLLTLALGISACGGTKSGGSKTPAGTYSVTVTATSGSLNHTATYSFTVK